MPILAAKSLPSERSLKKITQLDFQSNLKKKIS